MHFTRAAERLEHGSGAIGSPVAIMDKEPEWNRTQNPEEESRAKMWSQRAPDQPD